MTYRVPVTRTAARQLGEGLPEAVTAACVEFLYGPLAVITAPLGSCLIVPILEGCGDGLQSHAHLGLH